MINPAMFGIAAESALRAKKISGTTRRLHQDETARVLS